MCRAILHCRYPDEILSTKIIGERQFQKAVELFTSATEEVTGKIDYLHVYLNFTDIEVDLGGNQVVKTCPAALGPGFAAGTTDGPGVFGFQQGDTEVGIIQFPPFKIYSAYGPLWGFNGPSPIMPGSYRCLCADQPVLETLERFPKRTKPISGGLPKAQSRIAGQW